MRHDREEIIQRTVREFELLDRLACNLSDEDEDLSGCSRSAPPSHSLRQLHGCRSPAEHLPLIDAASWPILQTEGRRPGRLPAQPAHMPAQAGRRDTRA